MLDGAYGIHDNVQSVKKADHKYFMVAIINCRTVTTATTVNATIYFGFNAGFITFLVFTATAVALLHIGIAAKVITALGAKKLQKTDANIKWVRN